MDDTKIKPKLNIGYIAMKKQIIEKRYLEIGKRYNIIKNISIFIMAYLILMKNH